MNTFSDVLGVIRRGIGTNGASGVVFKSTEFGSDAFVSIDVTAGRGADRLHRKPFRGR